MRDNVMITCGMLLAILVGIIYVFAIYLPGENRKAQKAKAGNLAADTIYYAVFLLPIQSQELNNDVIVKHAQHLRELDAKGKLVLTGPFTDNPSGLIILRGESKDEIKSIIEQDPLIQGGFRSYEIRTWLMSDRANNYLPKLK